MVPLTHDDASFSDVHVTCNLAFDDGRIVPESSLCASLAIALSHFPPLAGRLVRRGRTMCVAFGGQSDHVAVVVKPYNAARKECPAACTQPGMVMRAGEAAKPGWMQAPQAVAAWCAYALRCALPHGHPAMQITIHQPTQPNPGEGEGEGEGGGEGGGGTVVSVRWNHAVADGGTMRRFLEAWALADRGGRIAQSAACQTPRDALSPRAYALLTTALLRESRASLYYPHKGPWAPVKKAVQVRFPSAFLSAMAHAMRTEEGVRGPISAVDVVACLLWLRMVEACLRREGGGTERGERGVGGERGAAGEGRVGWHPRMSFLVDMRHRMPELSPFTGNLARCTLPVCPTGEGDDPAAIAAMPDVRAVGRMVGRVRGARADVRGWSMRDVEERMAMPGLPLCYQSMQRELMSGEGGPCLLVNDLTSLGREALRFYGNASARVPSPSSSSSCGGGSGCDWGVLETASNPSQVYPSGLDFGPLEDGPFLHAFVKADGGDLVAVVEAST